QDALARAGQGVGERLATGATVDDDDVVVLGYHDPSASVSSSSPQSILPCSGSSSTDVDRFDPTKSHPHERKASTRWCTPLISQAWTPSHATNAAWPCSSWWWAPISAMAAPSPIMAMMPLSL